MTADKIFNKLPTRIRKYVRRFRFFFAKPLIRSLYKQFIKKGDLVFDVGAHIGDYTQIFLDLGAKVVCVEPNPYCTEILEKRFQNNENVFILKTGLGAHEKVMPFYISTQNAPTSTFSDEFKKRSRYGSREWDEVVEVPVTTLDKMIENYGLPTFCKIDVEGFEPQVLKGLSQPIPYLSVEYAQEMLDDTEKAVNRLEELGPIKFNYALYNTHILRSREWLSGKDLIDKVSSSKAPANCGDIYAKFD